MIYLVRITDPEAWGIYLDTLHQQHGMQIGQDLTMRFGGLVARPQGDDRWAWSADTKEAELWLLMNPPPGDALTPEV